jgi:gas vesicle protein
MLGTIIGAGISAGTGLLSAKKSEKHAQKMFNQNAQLQREFAQNGISWRVADARKSGIHPLVALGASTHSPSAVAMGADFSGISSAGQDISRAMQTAFKTPGRQAALYNAKVMELDLKNRELQNDYLASQIAKNTQAGQVPRSGIQSSPMLVDGQPDAGGHPYIGNIRTVPMRREASHKTNKYQEAGAVTDLGYARTAGGYAPTMSKDAKDRLDDDWPGMLWWNIRNRVAPLLGGTHFRPPPVRPKKGYQWYFNPATGEYRQIRKSGKKRPWHYMRK